MVVNSSKLRGAGKNTSVWRTVACFICACRKLNSLVAIYAGLFVLFVPSVLCKADWPRHLTYDQIYNNTHYAQLQTVYKPYTAVSSFSSHVNSPKYIHNDTRSNEIEEQLSYKDASGPLLVGFARDPFRYSVLEDDYRKGVRNIDPQVYMSKTENRGKRGVFHLYNMLYCATGCDPLSYKGYGCYCGFLGEGRPTDGIDRCCKLHDECYENIYCPFYTVYLQPYFWKCYHGQPLCALENFDSQHDFINRCAGRLCECDRKFAMCVRRYRCPRRRALCRSSPIRLLQNLLMFR
ncbi:uncharacterized protein LOC118269790 [Spodoptera frugiperda]|uniref:Phospholipase A2 n=2 Tax=Spodoptera frugiperda TaxID=7108 RepID=A0A9R0D5X6_SPOFR|nr:uncharacterized protein LOC118269790 [Spodoptera frugiperda]